MQKTITIKVKTEVEETINIDLPAYFADGNNQYKVDDDAVTQVGERFLFVNLKDGLFYDSTVRETVKLETSTDAAFMNAYNALMSLINPLVNNAKCITQPA